jgi:hypothetical protein
MEATGHSRWFERLLAELGFELWIGDPSGLGGGFFPQASIEFLGLSITVVQFLFVILASLLPQNMQSSESRMVIYAY